MLYINDDSVKKFIGLLCLCESTRYSQNKEKAKISAKIKR